MVVLKHKHIKHKIMKQILFTFLIFIIASCDIVNSNFTNDIVNRTNKTYPSYSEINKTTSKIIQDLRFVSPNIGLEYQDKITIRDTCGYIDEHGGCNSISYYFDTNAYVILDFNNDEKLDLFGHLEDQSADRRERPTDYNWWVRGPGKFALVSDYLGEMKIEYRDSPAVYGVRMDAGDFDNDGNDEVILSSIDTHSGTPPEYYNINWPIRMVEISPNGNVSWTDVTKPTHSNRVETGDIDGDGDIDFLYLEGRDWMQVVPREANILRFMINNGNGTFDEQSFRLKENSFIINGDFDYHNTGEFHIFDVNKDGCMDITIGDTQKSINRYNNDGQFIDLIVGGGVRILFNDCRGYFSIIENSLYFPIEMNSTVNGHTVHDVRYYDYDNDGDYDLFLLHELNTRGNVLGNEIEVFHNNNGTFVEVSNMLFPAGNEVRAKSINPNWNSYDDLPIFYTITFMDFDKDGFIDIVPRGSNYNGNWTSEYNEYMDGDEYFKNIGGKFIYTKNL
jgi:hypothetical protein